MSKAIRTAIAHKVRGAAGPVELGADEALAVSALIDEQGQNEAQRIKQERKDAAAQAALAAKDAEIADLRDQLKRERGGVKLTLVAHALAGGRDAAQAVKIADQTLAILRSEPAP